MINKILQLNKEEFEKKFRNELWVALRGLPTSRKNEVWEMIRAFLSLAQDRILKGVVESRIKELPVAVDSLNDPDGTCDALRGQGYNQALLDLKDSLMKEMEL